MPFVPAFNRTTAGLMARLRAARTGATGLLPDVSHAGMRTPEMVYGFTHGPPKKKPKKTIEEQLEEIQKLLRDGLLAEAAKKAADAQEEPPESVREQMTEGPPPAEVEPLWKPSELEPQDFMPPGPYSPWEES